MNVRHDIFDLYIITYAPTHTARPHVIFFLHVQNIGSIMTVLLLLLLVPHIMNVQRKRKER